MPLSEFALIDRFFRDQPVRRDDVLLGIGDDCALLQVPPGMQLAVSTDTLVADVHFLGDCDPADLGHRALAVNLSDLAAMGAEPAWVSLALTLPQVDERWLAGFCAGFFALAQRHRVQLIGGDTTRGPLSLTLQVQGFVPPGQALRRSGARPGDLVFVTGTLGDAALGLRAQQGRVRLADESHRYALQRFNRPEPRIAAGLALRGIASSAIDVSDGLLADLGHICAASGVGARIELAQLPLSDALRPRIDALGWELALAGGDDYELCFTVPEHGRAQLEAAARGLDCAVSCIGRIEAEPGLRCVRADGAPFRPAAAGYQHFAGDPAGRGES